MDSVRKRKASTATPAAPDGSASKKLKLLVSNPAASSRAKAQEVGQKLIEQLGKATDKNGRSIATHFLQLPDRDELPDYFEFTKLPIAVETIEAKLNRNEYPDVSAIESDLKRMVQNAKEYNDPSSQIYGDSEKIRKMVFNFMKQHNPAYKDQPGYSAVPTPLPEPGQTPPPPPKRASAQAERKAPAQVERKTPAQVERKPPAQVDRKPSVAPSATTGDADADEDGEAEDRDEEADGDDLDLDGKTFQEAQQLIVSHLLQYTDDEGLEIYTPFYNLPSRKLEDYYKIIRHPVCLKSVAKRARGQHGRAPPTGISDFKNWDQFTDEMSFIWRNAKDYNEDGSEMYDLATDFEDHFRSLIADARAKVEEPSGPKIKLGGPKPKVTLSLNQQRDSATPVAAASTAADVDTPAPARPTAEARVNGQVPVQPPATASVAPSGNAVLPARATSIALPGSPGPVKVEKGATMSPTPNGVVGPHQPPTNGTMLPPIARLSSGSPFPPSQPGAISSFHYTAPALLPPTQLRPYPLAAALLPAVTINTHPHLTVKPPFRLSLAPHPTLAVHSATLTLPASHYYLQFAPTIAKSLAMGRPYKLFVALNGARLTQRDTVFHADSGRRSHVYEGSLVPGVNRIEVEVAAASAAAAAAAAAASPEHVGDEGGEGGASTPESAGGRALDVEKVTIFANLLRA